MYTIYIENEAVYAPNLISEGYAVLNPVLDFELNKAGTLQFTLPPNNRCYDMMHKLKPKVYVYDGNTEIFRGRILNDQKDFYKRKSIYCEGDLAFLLDSVIRPYSFQGSIDDLFQHYINLHNLQVDEDKQFTVGDVTVTDKNDYVHYSSSVYPSTLDEIIEKLINTHGGYIRTRLKSGVRYIDYIDDYTRNPSQSIEFGTNLLDLNEFINAENVFTVLVPLGAKPEGSEERLTISSVNDGKDYIENQTGINMFGRITKTNVWDDVTIAANLKNKGIEFLNKGISEAVTLEIKAVDMHVLSSSTSAIKIGDYISVKSSPHNIDTYFQCSRIHLDLSNPQNSEYTFGVKYESMSNMLSDVKKG